MRLRAVLLCLLALVGCKSAATPKALFGRRAEVTFEGNVHFKPKRLLEAASLDVGELPRRTALRKARVDDAAFAMEAFYHGKGFPFALVEYEFEQSEKSQRVHFQVEEGPRSKLAEVRIVGDLAFDEEELIPFFEPPTGFLSRSGYYVEDRINAGARDLETFYYQSGYLDAKTEPHEVEFSTTGKRAKVTLQVQAGVRYRLRTIDFSGEVDVMPEELEDFADDRIDRPYTPHMGFRMRSRLIGMHQRRGYPDCQVELTPTIDVVTGDVHLLFDIAPGPLVRLGQVRVEGLDSVNFRLFRKRINVRPGQIYDANRVQESMRSLYLTGLFRTAEVELIGDGEVRDLVFRMSELPTLEFFVQPGYGSYEGARVVFGVTHKDFLDTGKRLRLESNLSNLAQGVNVNLLDPFVGKDLTLATTLSADRREEPVFTTLDFAARVTLTRSWTDDLSTSLAYELRESRLEDVDSDADPVEQDNINLGTLSIGSRWDQTDSVFYPSQGTRARASLDYATKAVGSTVDFLRPQLDIQGYIDMGWDVTTVLSWRTGVAIPLEAEEIPIQERFFLGGENTVRSFRQDQLGVSDGLTSGGEASNVFNFELRRRLIGNVSGALFYDIGAIQERHQDWGFDDFGQGIGFGLRYMLPIGPVRVDAAWNPDPGSEDEDWVVHLSVGMPF